MQGSKKMCPLLLLCWWCVVMSADDSTGNADEGLCDEFLRILFLLIPMKWFQKIIAVFENNQIYQ